MTEATLHRRSLYSITEPTASDGSSSRNDGPDPSFAIIPNWSTRLKVTSRGCDTKDCLLLNIKPRVAVTVRPGEPASMSFDMVGGVLSGPGCEAVDPAQAWKTALGNSESARTIPTVVERIAALEQEWKAFLTRFSDVSNADMTRDFSCRVTSRKNSLLVVNRLSEDPPSTLQHQFFLECYEPIAVRPKEGRASPTSGSAGDHATVQRALMSIPVYR
ncbi:hypothetical protein EHS25_001636 [Saitozyma podzolica]|uniref:Uncharacterized protein n=1 Tax=Saitozyma podzolica TaxID=1890683 RepID=A0A427YGU1_9TREE|nr:hypothetical protein EHS25_001636 [Saitozyma podzolica]